jgi:hypothetical protein
MAAIIGVAMMTMRFRRRRRQSGDGDDGECNKCGFHRALRMNAKMSRKF